MMKKRCRRTAAAFLTAAVLISAVFSGCRKQEQKTPSVEGLETIHETEFGGVYLKMTIDDFNKLGFSYGDSVDLEFSNGYKLEDLPYYNGYYVDAGQPLLIAYPGYDYIKAAINYGEDLWEKAGLKDGLLAVPKLLGAVNSDLFSAAELDGHSTAKIVLHERGKYKDIQDARDIHYSDERSKFDSDEIFANFRNMTVGNLKEGAVYRSASPCDNQHNRAPYVDALIREAGVNCILDLADNETKIEKYISAEGFSSPYFLSLYEGGKVIPLALSMNYMADEFGQKIAEGFRQMAETDGPCLVHCTEGKDRTGFVCMLIGMLAGASYRELVDDYMVTYQNYYKITEASEKAKYDVILDKNLNAMMRWVIGDENADLEKADLQTAAEKYLLAGGMTAAGIAAFLEKITK